MEPRGGADAGAMIFLDSCLFRKGNLESLVTRPDTLAQQRDIYKPPIFGLVFAGVHIFLYHGSQSPQNDS